MSCVIFCDVIVSKGFIFPGHLLKELVRGTFKVLSVVAQFCAICHVKKDTCDFNADLCHLFPH